MSSDRMSSSDIFTFCRHYPSYSKHHFSPLQRQTGYCWEGKWSIFVWQSPGFYSHVIFLGWWSMFRCNMLLPSSGYELHPCSYCGIMWQLYVPSTHFGQNADFLWMKQAVRIVTTTFSVNVISMAISLVSFSGQWLPLCRPTHLLTVVALSDKSHHNSTC